MRADGATSGRNCSYGGTFSSIIDTTCGKMKFVDELRCNSGAVDGAGNWFGGRPWLRLGHVARFMLSRDTTLLTSYRPQSLNLPYSTARRLQ